MDAEVYLEIIRVLFRARKQMSQMFWKSVYNSLSNQKEVSFSQQLSIINLAILNKTTITSETVLLIITVSGNLYFQHYYFAYHNYANIKKIIEHKLVTRLKLDFYVKPDPICELCIAEKILSNSFSSSLNYNNSPLSLIHSDLYDLLPIATY